MNGSPDPIFWLYNFIEVTRFFVIAILIFNKEITNTQRLVRSKIKGKTETKSDIQLISLTLNEKDTSFVYNQYKNKEFNIENLKPFGYKVIDWKNIRDDIYIGDSLVEERVFVAKDSLDNIYQYLEQNSSISLSKPIFNKSLSKAYIEVDFSQYHGNGYLFEKKNNMWKFINYAGGWTRGLSKINGNDYYKNRLAKQQRFK